MFAPQNYSDVAVLQLRAGSACSPVRLAALRPSLTGPLLPASLQCSERAFFCSILLQQSEFPEQHRSFMPWLSSDSRKATSVTGCRSTLQHSCRARTIPHVVHKRPLRFPVLAPAAGLSAKLKRWFRELRCQQWRPPFGGLFCLLACSGTPLRTVSLRGRPATPCWRLQAFQLGLQLWMVSGSEMFGAHAHPKRGLLLPAAGQADAQHCT